MNVLIVTFLVSHSPSGVVTYYKTLANDLRSRNIPVTIIESTDTPYVWNKTMNIGGHIARRLGKVINLFYREFAYFVRLYWGVRARRNLGFTVIHAQDVRSGVAAYFALGRKVPVVLTCHFNDDPITEVLSMMSLRPLFVRWLTRWYTYLFRHVKNYVFVSHYAYEQSKHLLPADINKVILHNTVRIDSQSVDAGERNDNAMVISNVGYIDERKNQKLLILIGDELRKRGVADFRIWLIGDGPKRPEYERLVADLNLNEQVKFYGRQAAPWRLVAQTDLYVHTALNDNCPYSILEAFAVKTPVLALPVGGVPELLPGESGRLESADPVRAADQILQHFDLDKRTKLAEIQSAYANVKFNHETALAELISFYQQSVN